MSGFTRAASSGHLFYSTTGRAGGTVKNVYAFDCSPTTINVAVSSPASLINLQMPPDEARAMAAELVAAADAADAAEARTRLKVA